MTTIIDICFGLGQPSAFNTQLLNIVTDINFITLEGMTTDNNYCGLCQPNGFNTQFLNTVVDRIFTSGNVRYPFSLLTFFSHLAHLWAYWTLHFPH